MSSSIEVQTANSNPAPASDAVLIAGINRVRYKLTALNAMLQDAVDDPAESPDDGFLVAVHGIVSELEEQTRSLASDCDAALAAKMNRG